MLAKTEAGDTQLYIRQLRRNPPVAGFWRVVSGHREATAIATGHVGRPPRFRSGDYRSRHGASADDLSHGVPAFAAGRFEPSAISSAVDGPPSARPTPFSASSRPSRGSGPSTGKLCLDRPQIAVINETISPTSSDVTWARDFLADFEARGRVVAGTEAT